MVDVFLQRLVEDEDVVEEGQHADAVEWLESCRDGPNESSRAACESEQYHFEFEVALVSLDTGPTGFDDIRRGDQV